MLKVTVIIKKDINALNLCLIGLTSLDMLSLAQYFPTLKSTKLKNDIVCFQQEEDEMVCEAWERFQGLLRKCPNHSFRRPYLVQIFHNSLTPSTKTILDISARGAFDKNTYDEAYLLLEELFANQHQPHPRAQTRRVSGVHEVDAQTKLEAQVASLTIHLEKARNAFAVQGSQSVVLLCTNCGGNHAISCCPGGTN
ncbi:hypothetical protein LIER_10821 [Lithospermum erythrorhizon]|uniref:Retrotransposon gag domain-containing protein n=1 Tax=Lithospermum erythrorhizon TaxID=34254 RepID=A0AAV3PKS4_LITER